MKNKITRREFIAAAGGTAVQIGLPGFFYKASAAENHAWTRKRRPDGRPKLPPGQHAVGTLQNMGGTVGLETAAEWRLKISGEVEKPQSLTWEQIKRMQRTEQICDVHCVTGWSLLDAKWGGIRFTDIMALARVKPTAGFVIFEGPGGYSSNIPMREAVKENVLLADRFNGTPLPEVYGGPLRALIPDLYFWKSTKWLQSVKFTTEDEPGYYESSGYSNSADPWKEERFQ